MHVERLVDLAEPLGAVGRAAAAALVERKLELPQQGRHLFTRGDIDEATLGVRPSLGHVTAREEVTTLLRQLKLPLDERGRRRAANRVEWFTQIDKPLEVHDILGA